jgi:hypothetical protein
MQRISWANIYSYSVNMKDAVTHEQVKYEEWVGSVSLPAEY